MSQSFASGKESLAICDRCGLRGPYSQMVWDGDVEVEALRVHSWCMDALNPDIVIARKLHVEPEALRNPRPDRVQDAIYTTLSGNYTVLATNELSDQDTVFLCPISLTITIPLGTASLIKPGWRFYAQNTGNTTGVVVTLACQGSNTINGYSSVQLFQNVALTAAERAIRNAGNTTWLMA